MLKNVKIKFPSLILLTITTFGLVAGKQPEVFAQFPPQRSICTATLTASSPSARINLRSGAGTNYQSRGYGLVGDFIYILSSSPPESDYRQDSQGNLWYRVEFPKSMARGWIREDFLRFQCGYD